MKELKLGVVGLGLGRHFVGACVGADSVGRLVVGDPDPERMDSVRKEFPGVARGYGEIEQMLAEEKLDAVCIVTHDHLHRPERAAGVGRRALAGECREREYGANPSSRERL